MDRMPTQLADLFAAPPPPIYKGVTAVSHYHTMRDGVQIALDVMTPADLPPGTRLPTLLIMARYWRSMELRMPSPPNKAPIGPREQTVDYFVPRGFAVVVVDGRGTGASHGVSRHPWSEEELADYGEIAAWIVAQPWSNGRIGAYGISYEGATAQRLLAVGGAAVRGVIPQEIEFDVYPDVALPGGVFNLAFIRAWSESNQKLDNSQPSSLFPWLVRPLVKGVRPVDADRADRAQLRQAIADHQANTDVYQAMTHVTYRDDPFGDTGVTLDDFSVFAHSEAIERSGAPIFTWGSWLDGAAAEAALRNFNSYSNPQICVIGAWKHEMTAHGSPYQRPKAAPNPGKMDQWAAMAQFFQETLVAERPLSGKTLFYYTLGAETWRQTGSFPLPDTEMQTWYFQAGGGLSPEPPAVAGTDTYTVNFAATTGKTNRWHTQMARPLIYPNRAKEDGRLLTYTSAPLPKDMEITGYPILTLHVAANVPDAAFFAYLEEVDEKGVVRYLTEGQLRAIHRRLADEPAPYRTGMPYRSFKRADAAPLPPGEMVELTFGLLPISALIRRGRRLRLALAGADADTFARIPAQGGVAWQVGRGQPYASAIQLPVVG